jgi:hypothetical protein
MSERTRVDVRKEKRTHRRFKVLLEQFRDGLVRDFTNVKSLRTSAIVILPTVIDCCLSIKWWSYYSYTIVFLLQQDVIYFHHVDIVIDNGSSISQNDFDFEIALFIFSNLVMHLVNLSILQWDQSQSGPAGKGRRMFFGSHLA